MFHNIFQIHNSFLWDWRYSEEYSSYSSHLHTDVLVSDPSHVIIGTQDFKGKCLKKGSLLSTIGGGSTYWHLYQFQGTSQAIDVKNVNWL